MPWVIKYGEHEFAESSLTLAECEAIEGDTGESWLYINPYRSAKHCHAIIKTLLVMRDGVEAVEVDKQLKTMRAKDLLDSISFVDDDAPDSFTDGNPTEGEHSTGG